MAASGSPRAGPDGLPRCAWALGAEDYRRYHDEEWGVPVRTDTALLERLVLEGFQAGLSWLTILRKREAFRLAFAGFAPATVAAYTEQDVARLLTDASIVRHRGKIEAAITNARALCALQRRDGPDALSRLVWGHAPATHPVPRRLRDVPARTAESAALARALRREGFVFVGPTTVYAAMQACGVVDDHLAGCAFRAGPDEDGPRLWDNGGQVDRHSEGKRTWRQ